MTVYVRRLHLGCGTRRLDGFIHVDSRAECEPDVVCDITKLDEFDTDSVAMIYASHVLEHVPRPQVVETLLEWKRVLRPGYPLRLAVPDFRVLAKLYVNDRVPFWRLVGPLYGRQNYPENTHYCGFDYDYLAWLLGEAGFYDVRLWDPEQVLPEGYDDYSLARIDGKLISLCLEATAP